MALTEQKIGMHFMGMIAGYTLSDHKSNEEILK
jgi:hypothetical protein